jgi:hypothetical protein
VVLHDAIEADQGMIREVSDAARAAMLLDVTLAGVLSEETDLLGFGRAISAAIASS